jgi:hypothetical protein
MEFKALPWISGRLIDRHMYSHRQEEHRAPVTLHAHADTNIAVPLRLPEVRVMPGSFMM